MLALLGGSPAFAAPLHVGRPNRGQYEQFEGRMRGIWDRNWLTNDGPMVREFEAALASFLDVPHCVAVCNATIGLEIASRALGLTGEVIVPSFTFVASAHCLRWQGIRPVFCDADHRSHQLSVESVENLITDQTTGILAVHLWGNAAPIEELTALAERKNLKLLFDAAHAIGSTHQQRPIGAFGDAEVFSFHATKCINSFEGGVITTRSEELAQKMRLMRNFGFAGYDRVIHVGTNGKMTEVCAAMGLTSLENANQIFAANRANLELYTEQLRQLPGIRVRQPNAGEKSNCQYVVAEIEADELGLTRDQLQAVLHAENVLVRRYFYPGCHRMEPYRSEPESTPQPLPVTESLTDRVLQFPTGTTVSETMIRRITEIVESAHAQAAAIRDYWDRRTAGGQLA